MKFLEDFYEKCYCDKVLLNIVYQDHLVKVYQCPVCGYGYVVAFEQLAEV